jgi:two-component system chemotaxis response regulator CheB
MSTQPAHIVAIAGSAGAITIVPELLAALPGPFPFAVVIILHRMRNVHSDLLGMLAAHMPGRKMVEPDDKEPVKQNTIYLAPQNYHLLVEDGHFSLDYSEAVMFSRPSIDVTFDSVARAYGPHATAILLSGANTDGAAGIKTIIEHGGRGIVQDPKTAAYPTMPDSAINLAPGVLIYTPEQIKHFLTTDFCK